MIKVESMRGKGMRVRITMMKKCEGKKMRRIEN